jgi:hypothetical protein
MKVNSNNRDISFNGFYNSSTLKRGLEFAADNGALFAATTTLALSVAARPAAILLTPNTDKENKKIAFTKSLVSSFLGYLVMLALSSPLSRGMKKIDSNPEKFLNNDTIKNLKDGAETLQKSKAYSLATQMFKLGLGLVAAVPKAILTAMAIPPTMNAIFPQEENMQNSSLTFKGKNSIPDGISNVLSKKGYQEFAKKYKNSNFPMHIIAGTDTLSTGAFIYQIQKNNSITKERKDTLCFNSVIATGLSIASSYFVDSLTNKPMEKFIEKFKAANKNSPKLDKYVEGIKIAKPILIVGGIYYIVIPFVSTFLADRAENLFLKLRGGNKQDKRNDNQTSDSKNSESVNISP